MFHVFDKKQKMKGNLFKSISSGYVLFFLNSIVAIFLTPYILKYISKEEYGLYILCIDFLAWFTFLQFGTNKVIESKAAHQLAEDDYKSLNTSFNASFFFQILVGLLIIPLFYYTIKENINDEQISEANILILLFSISAGISVFRSLYSAVIIATKKIYIDNYIQIGLNIFNFLLVILLMPTLKLLGLAYINLLIVVLILIRSHFRLKHLLPLVKVNFKKFEYSELKKLLGTGFYFTIGSISTIFLVKIDSFIIGRELGLDIVGYFYITVKIFFLFQKVCNVFLNNFRPHISQLYAKSQFKSIHFIFQFLNDKFLILILFFSAFLMILNKYFVEFWVGNEFYLGNDFSILFGFAIVLEILTIPSRIVLISSLFDVNYISYFRSLEAVFRLLGIIVFYQYFGLNIMPIMSIISSIMFGHFFFHFKLKKYFNQNLIVNVKSNLTILFALTLLILFLYAINEINYFVYCMFSLSIILIFGKRRVFIKEYLTFKNLLK